MLLLVWTLRKDGVSVNSANSETENVNESYCCHCTCVSQTQVALPPSNKCSLLSACLATRNSEARKAGE